MIMRLFVSVLIFSAFIAACGQNDKKNVPGKEQKPVIRAIGNNPADQLVHHYMQLKDALVKDSIKVVNDAAALMSAAGKPDTVQLKNLPEEVQKDFVSLNKDIHLQLMLLWQAPDLQSKRTIFRGMTAAVRELAEKCGSSNNKLYQQHCPMAFNDTGASWLSYETKIRNPYLPKTMLRCGLVEDTLKQKN
jgi:membrane fusion protein, copper/silver efflux system